MHRTRSFTAEERATWVPLVAVLELLPKQLDTQLKRDEQLSHFDYFVLSLLALSDGRTLRMSTLAIESNATLPRLSHVVSRLEERGFVRRLPAPEDARRRRGMRGFSKAPGPLRLLLLCGALLFFVVLSGSFLCFLVL